MIVFCTGGRRPAKKFSSGRSNKIFARDRETRFRSEAGPRCAQSEKKKGRGEGEGGCCYFKTFQTMILPVSIQPPHSPPPLLCMCARACIVDTFYWLLQKFNILLPPPRTSRNSWNYYSLRELSGVSVWRNLELANYVMNKIVTVVQSVAKVSVLYYFGKDLFEVSIEFFEYPSYFILSYNFGREYFLFFNTSDRA